MTSASVRAEQFRLGAVGAASLDIPELNRLAPALAEASTGIVTAVCFRSSSAQPASRQRSPSS